MRTLARGPLLVCFAVLASAATFFGWHLRARPAENDALRASFPLAVCGGTPTQVEAFAAGELLLHKELLPGGVLSQDALHAAVTLALRYAFATLQNRPAASSVLIPDGPPHTVEVIEQQETTYGKDLLIDWEHPADPHLRPESDYVKAALAKKVIAASDAALRVKWRARLGLASCDKAGEAPWSLHLPAPLDPYLLYWSVDKEHRVTQIYGVKRARTFPCASSELADYDHPEYLFYYWQPSRIEPDLGVFCANLLRPGSELSEVSLHVIRRSPPSGDLSRFQNNFPAQPLRIVALFGYLTHQVARPNSDEIRDCVLSPLGEKTCAYAESGTNQYIRFLRKISEVLDEKSRVLTVQKDDLLATLTGTLRGSHHKVSLTAHLMETDFLAPPPYAPRHIPLLVESLSQAEVLIYAGHSGFGGNFSLLQLVRGTSQDAVEKALRASPLRLLGFVGCETYSYFGRDFSAGLKKFKNSRDPILFAYTGNPVSETADSALHVLATLDCLLSPGSGTANGCVISAPGRSERPDFMIYQ